MNKNQRALIIFFGQLGDFDSIEYAQALTQVLDKIGNAGIFFKIVAIGDAEGADRFCTFTGLPRHNLFVLADNTLHRRCGLYAGLKSGFGPWIDLFLMCAGIGSPGTLKEVFRGYTGDPSAEQRIQDSIFSILGSGDSLRPFELASVRLINMIEVLTHWQTYVPNHQYLCQRGATFICEGNGDLIYRHNDIGILGFSETMNHPLRFLEPYL